MNVFEALESAADMLPAELQLRPLCRASFGRGSWVGLCNEVVCLCLQFEPYEPGNIGICSVNSLYWWGERRIADAVLDRTRSLQQFLPDEPRVRVDIDPETYKSDKTSLAEGLGKPLQALWQLKPEIFRKEFWREERDLSPDHRVLNPSTAIVRDAMMNAVREAFSKEESVWSILTYAANDSVQVWFRAPAFGFMVDYCFSKGTVDILLVPEDKELYFRESFYIADEFGFSVKLSSLAPVGGNQLDIAIDGQVRSSQIEQELKRQIGIIRSHCPEVLKGEGLPKVNGRELNKFNSLLLQGWYGNENSGFSREWTKSVIAMLKDPSLAEGTREAFRKYNLSLPSGEAAVYLADEVIGPAFCDEGLADDGELNERGWYLDDLAGKINKHRIALSLDH